MRIAMRKSSATAAQIPGIAERAWASRLPTNTHSRSPQYAQTVVFRGLCRLLP